MTKKIPASSSGISTIDGLLEELSPYLYIGKYSPIPGRQDALELQGRVRLPDLPAAELNTSAKVRRALFDRSEEIVTLLGNRLIGQPELVMNAEPMADDDEATGIRWMTYADVRLTIGYA